MAELPFVRRSAKLLSFLRLFLQKKRYDWFFFIRLRCLSLLSCLSARSLFLCVAQVWAFYSACPDYVCSCSFTVLAGEISSMMVTGFVFSSLDMSYS